MNQKFFYDLIEEKKGLYYTPSTVTQRFPYQLCILGHICFGDKFYTEREKDKKYQLIYTVAGNGILKYRGKTISVDENQAVLINAYDYHYYCTGRLGFWEYKWLNIKGSGCSNFFDLINQDSVYAVTFDDPLEFNHCFDQMIDILESKDLDGDLKLPLLVMEILTAMALNRKKNEYSSKPIYHKGIIDNAIGFINENFSRSNLRIGDVAKEVGYNERYFSQLFLRLTGTNLYEHITRLRIDKAKHLLKNTLLTVAEVAAESGFENINVFIRAFKKYNGTTPLKFRIYDVIQS